MNKILALLVFILFKFKKNVPTFPEYEEPVQNRFLLIDWFTLRRSVCSKHILMSFRGKASKGADKETYCIPHKLHN